MENGKEWVKLNAQHDMLCLLNLGVNSTFSLETG